MKHFLKIPQEKTQLHKNFKIKYKFAIKKRK